MEQTLTESGTHDFSSKTIEKLIIKGNNIKVVGLKMVNLTNKCLQLLGDDITLEKCSFNGCNKSEVCIQVKGQRCRITNCLFENMNKKSCLIMISVFKNKFSHCLIDNCNFRDMKEGDSNGWEVIRIGDSKSSLYDGRSVIYNNFFSNCNREIELISNKSCRNIIAYNKIVDCMSCITLRHGRYCMVLHNYINGGSRKDCGGVRIMGKGHIVKYNTIEGIDNEGNPFRSPFSIMNGELNNKLNGYEQVKDLQLCNNDILGCRVAFSFGVNNKRKSQIIPNKCLIEGNRIVKCVKMIDDNEKCIGLSNSFVDNNEVIDKDVRIEIPKAELEFANVEDLYRQLQENKVEEKEEESENEGVDEPTIDFKDMVAEINRLKNEEKESKCNKCEIIQVTLQKAQKRYEKNIKDMKKENEELKKQLEEIKELLF